MATGDYWNVGVAIHAEGVQIHQAAELLYVK